MKVRLLLAPLSPVFLSLPFPATFQKRGLRLGSPEASTEMEICGQVTY